MHYSVHLLFMCMCVQDVTLDNVEEYIDLVMDFCFNSGIRRQMDAFKGKPYVHIFAFDFILSLSLPALYKDDL